MDYRKLELLHAESLEEDIASLKGDRLARHQLLGIAYRFEQLLQKAAEVVTAEPCDLREAVGELEELLR